MALELLLFKPSANIGVRIRTMFSLFSVVDYNGLVCVFEFGEPKRPSTNTVLPEVVNLKAWRFLAALEMIT